MLQERTLALLDELNPWWTGRLPEVPAFRRSLFRELERTLPPRPMLAVVGLRRTGKTILLFQLIRHLLSSVPPKNILYFLFDDLTAQTPEALEDLLNHY